MILLLSQKNQLFELIQNSGIGITQFKYDEESNTAFIRHKSNYYYKIIVDNISYWSEFSPGKNSLRYITGKVNWSTTITEFTNWLSFLKREVLSIDKWSVFEQELDKLSLNQEDSSSYFSVDEYEIVKSRMLSLKLRLANISLDKNQLAVLEEKIDYLIEEAKHQKKFDWKSLFIGTIVSIIIQLSISQEQGKQIWDLIKEIFNNYFLP